MLRNGIYVIRLSSHSDHFTRNDIILIVHRRKRLETLVRVLQSENGECHEMTIMEPLWTLLSTFNKGRRKKIVHCSR